MHVHFNSWNMRLEEILFHPFQPPFENVATSVVGSLLVQIIVIKHLSNSYYVPGGMQSSLYTLSHYILTKFY